MRLPNGIRNVLLALASSRSDQRPHLTLWIGSQMNEDGDASQELALSLSDDVHARLLIQTPGKLLAEVWINYYNGQYHVSIYDEFDLNRIHAEGTPD